MGAGLGNTDEDAALRKTLTEAFEKKGYTVVATPEEADVLYLHVWPISNGLVFNQYAMPVIEMGEIVTDERERNKSQKKTGNKVTVVTLKDVEKIKELADAIHARGGKVVGTCVVCNPWLLDKLEPYCDALTIQYTVSAVALNNALNAQVDVISGDFAPTGKLSLTMVSDPAVIAITEQEIDGVVREICASPNDVPGYDKDQYIDPAHPRQRQGRQLRLLRCRRQLLPQRLRSELLINVNEKRAIQRLLYRSFYLLLVKFRGDLSQQSADGQVLRAGLFAPAALDAVRCPAACAGIDIIIVKVGVPVVMDLLGVHHGEQVGDGRSAWGSRRCSSGRRCRGSGSCRGRSAAPSSRLPARSRSGAGSPSCS